ncbi:ankyrin repeat domain-containing protein [Bacteroidota bacterium]
MRKLKNPGVIALVFLLSICQFAFAGPNEDLVSACMNGDLNAVNKALDAGADVNKIDENGNTAIATAYFWPEITELLLSKGADPNLGNYPALISACNVYSTEVVKMLLDAGADPNKKGVADPTVVFKKLIENEKAKGKSANKAAIKAWEGMIGTMQPSEVELMQILVQQTNCVPCLKMVLEKGAKLELQDGNTVLDVLASFSMAKEERKTAFTQGAPTYESFGYKLPDWYKDLPDDRNGTAVEMLELLMSKGLDINKPNTLGLTPLVVALKGCNAVESGKASKLAVVNKMVELGADPALPATQIFEKGEAVYYPICLAAEFGNVELVSMMLDKGADMNSTTTTTCLSMFNGTWGGEGYTPLIIAIMVKNYDIAKYLVDIEADIKIGTNGYSIMETAHEDVKCMVSSKNKTPIYWAVEKDDMILIEKIAERMVWKFNPDFSFKVISDVETVNMGFYKVGCKKGKEKLFPSAYSSEIGNKEATKYLRSKGL